MFGIGKQCIGKTAKPIIKKPDNVSGVELMRKHRMLKLNDKHSKDKAAPSELSEKT